MGSERLIDILVYFWVQQNGLNSWPKTCRQPISRRVEIIAKGLELVIDKNTQL